MRTTTFIPKRLYPAVMFARKMMRDGKPVGLAVYHSSNYYGVDSREIASWLRGKKRVLTAAEKKAQKWYYAIKTVACDANPVPNIVETFISQTSNRTNERRKMERQAWNETRHNDTGSSYSRYFDIIFCDKLYPTKREATAALKEHQRRLLKEWGNE